MNTKSVNLDNVPAYCARVKINDIQRTKEDYVRQQITTIFSSNTFESLLINVEQLRMRLLQLGCFRDVKAIIDKAQDSKLENSYDITYAIEEHRPISGGMNTAVGQNEGSLCTNFSLPNLFGRGEKLGVDYSYSNRGNTEGRIFYSMPTKLDPNKQFSISLFRTYFDNTWSSFKQDDHGINISYNIPLGIVPNAVHSFTWEGVWRSVLAASSATSLDVRKDAGHTLKSSLKYTATIDNRDHPVIAQRGSFSQSSLELAGLGGDSQFVKWSTQHQINLPLPLKSVFQWCFSAGAIWPLLQRGNQTIKINDRFFLGGPLNVRGFDYHGAGPHSEGAALGGDCYWATGLHLYTPLPFLYHRENLMSYVRLHYFLNAGNVFNSQSVHSTQSLLSQLTNTTRLSCGLGVVLNLMNVARLELNYTLPLWTQVHDRVIKGFQFGIIIMTDDQPWMIVQKQVDVFDKLSAFIYCDRRQHLLVFNHSANRNISISSSSSTISIPDALNISHIRSTHAVDLQTVIYLERIQYIQRGGSSTNRRSARDYNQLQTNRQPNQNGHYDPQKRQIEIYYSKDQHRSEYLYKSITFQLMIVDDECDKWINALYTVIDEAKNLSEAGKRNRWLLREYEKLKRSSGGLTIDSINNWLSSHIGLIGEKQIVEKRIQENKIFAQSNEITDSVFKATYNYLTNQQQKVLMKILASDIIEENQISLEAFASRVTNNEIDLVHHESENIREFLRLNNNQREITLKQAIDYLWSEANSAFDPICRTQCNQDMNQPLNHYWISSSHNTYLAKTQIFNPASVHCYIQSLLKGCRCIEIDVFDSRTGGEPEVTHKNTRIKPIPLREILEAVHDYAFATSEYPIIISIENHCSVQQRFVMTSIFKEIFRESLVQSPLSPNETCYPSPKQLKRRIILKDSKSDNVLTIESQASSESDEQVDSPPNGLDGHIQLYDFAKKDWFHYNYSFQDKDLYLGKDQDIHKQRNSDEDTSDDETKENNKSDDELTQIWYHRAISHQDAERILLSNAGYESGTFLIRKSPNKNCYCVTFLASNSTVKSIQIEEERNKDGKILYFLSQKKFDSIPDLVSHYRTYDFAEIVGESTKTISYRLTKPLPRAKWRQELQRQPWYQPNLTRQQAEELLLGIAEEMTFLIRDSSNRARQDYTISVYINGIIRHSPIYRDGSDLMLMSLTFTSLIELVNYFSRKPIFRKLCLQKPAKSYADFINEQRQFKAQGINTHIIIFKTLDDAIQLKVDTLRTLQVDQNSNNQSVQVQYYIYDENKKKNEGYVFKFDTVKDYKMFSEMLCPGSSQLLPISLPQDEIVNNMHSLSTGPKKLTPTPTSLHQSPTYIAELNKLIVYCQSIKMKAYNINKAQDLERIRSFREMISLSNAKATTFCSDVRAMLLFNRAHFTRIYPDFSRRSWSSYNFEPIPYWFTGCQLVALNFQTPDRPMHINAGRFAANGGCGYVLMPNYMRSFYANTSKIDTKAVVLKIRVLAVRNLRANQSKSISKVQVKATIVNRQKLPGNQTCSTIINGPCGIWDSKQSSKNSDQLHTYHRLQSDDGDVDLLYFEVLTDNEEFCGQSTIPLSSLRSGIRSVQLYDKFNEYLDMSALLVDLIFKAGILFFNIF
ncbi:unnamed protein product [Rotaria sp. Silwood2]|nr:unnamed protein product [Rotaria sp. Silwood2]